jgi:hypothetical protein
VKKEGDRILKKHVNTSSTFKSKGKAKVKKIEKP